MHFKVTNKVTKLFSASILFIMTSCNNLKQTEPEKAKREHTEKASTIVDISGTWEITELIGKDGNKEKPPAGVETVFTFNRDSTYSVAFKKNNVQGPGYTGKYNITLDSVLHTYYTIGEEKAHDEGKILSCTKTLLHVKDMNASGDIMVFTKRNK